MHCTYYNTMKEGDDCKMIMISRSQYENLVKYVEDKFDRDQNGNFMLIPTNAVYGDNDAFMMQRDLQLSVYLQHWSNNALKAAGQKSRTLDSF